MGLVDQCDVKDINACDSESRGLQFGLGVLDHREFHVE